MKKIQLTQGVFAQVDDSRFEELSARKWRALKRGDTFYAICNISQDKGKKKTVLMHRMIKGFPLGLEIDHIDHDGLNNQESNLRLVSHSQNQMNRRGPNRTNISGYLGVDRRKNSQFWRARIRVEGREIDLGLFGCPTAAALARDAAAKKHHGNMARLNFQTTPISE